MAIRAAGLLSAALGVGFGSAMAISLCRLGRGRELPMTPFGFRAFEGGPFDALPRPVFMVMGCVLLGTCLLDLLAGTWLWQGRLRGGRLALLTSPVGLALAVGFALPLLLVGIPLRGALLLLGWRHLRR
jgi:hypothetical protein